jgi:hypothetical protein
MAPSRVYALAGAALILLAAIYEKIEESASRANSSHRFLSERVARVEWVAASSHGETCAIWGGVGSVCDCDQATSS